MMTFLLITAVKGGHKMLNLSKKQLLILNNNNNNSNNNNMVGIINVGVV